MALPVFTTQIKELSQMQTAWSTQLNPVLRNPATNPVILKNVELTAGLNKINHLLQRNLQGWLIVRQRAAATIYDQQDDNQTPGLTLWLVSTAPVIVDLEVF